MAGLASRRALLGHHQHRHPPSPGYDIPCRYAPAPPPHTAELLRCYDTAATASRRAAITLDGLAVTIDSPSSTLAVARVSSGSAVTVPGPTDDDGRQAQAQPAAPTDVLGPQAQAGQIEDILRSLHITEPGMLLRAAAIDDAARDVLARASVSSRKRDTINLQPPQRKPGTPDQAARTAAKDLIQAAAADQHVTQRHPIPSPRPTVHPKEPGRTHQGTAQLPERA